MDASHKLLTGTLDMLILDVLARGESYGFQIAQTVLAQSRGRIELKEGSLYPALHRLQRQRLLKPRWVMTGEGRRRKYYTITPKGLDALEAKREEWLNFEDAVRGVLNPGPRSARNDHVLA